MLFNLFSKLTNLQEGLSDELLITLLPLFNFPCPFIQHHFAVSMGGDGLDNLSNDRLFVMQSLFNAALDFVLSSASKRLQSSSLKAARALFPLQNFENTMVFDSDSNIQKTLPSSISCSSGTSFILWLIGWRCSASLCGSEFKSP